MKRLPLGPVVIDIAGCELTPLDRERLCHPLVGGLILFSRNFVSPAQLTALCAEVHGLREPPLPIAVDHEGGRVQRFREGFTRLPAMGRLGQLWDRDPAAAQVAARDVGYVLAAELRACGVDLSFTPVLDLDYGRSGVIGDRAFHREPTVVAMLASALIEGLRSAGMAACGKHFPGHGWVEADSHVAIPVDDRDEAQILAADIEPYRQLQLDAVMPAHVIYPKVDHRPAGFSPVWQAKLRQLLGPRIIVFSDDLSMEGASVAGDVVARCEAAWAAGCDMLLVCNRPEAVGDLLERWRPIIPEERNNRAVALLPTKVSPGLAELAGDAAYRTSLIGVGALTA